ncbi:MAG: hypothetical protein MN733_25070 [Nitrososphaera sp.]|nr:hypothetical protein [Nitrososphaera sp.]
MTEIKPMHVLRQLLVVVIVSFGVQVSASGECAATKSLKQRLKESTIVFVGEVVEARVQTIAEYKYYRAPGTRSWVSESAISPELKKISEMNISRDREVWARFQDIRVFKGSFDSNQEIRMGTSARVMGVTIGNLYLVFSTDGKTTSYCEGAVEMSGWDADIIEKIQHILNENASNR